MTISKRLSKAGIWTLCIVCVLLLIYWAAVSYVHAHFQLKISPPKSSLTPLKGAIEKTDAELRNGKIPYRNIDRRSVGLPLQESVGTDGKFPLL